MRSTTFLHEQNGPFVQGLPTLQGWYWFFHSEAKKVGAYPALVLLGVGESVITGVRVWGWNNDDVMSIEDDFVTQGYYAPMSPPEMP